MVRVAKETKEALHALACKMADSMEPNPTLNKLMRSDVVTLDVVIRVLLARDARHRERRKNSAANKRLSRQEKAMYTCEASNGLSSPEATDGMVDA